jgi:D-alanyl-D-alanine dipeptidase
MNKVPSRILQFLIIISLILITFIQPAVAQQQKQNPYQIEILSDVNRYNSLIAGDPDKKLVDLQQFIPGIKLDIRYASTHNFTKQVVYTSAKAYLRLPAAVALKSVEKELAKQNLGLKVFDAYRPYAATLLFYQLFKDTNFVAAPWKGSVHNRGCAVDVTLIDLKTGKELMMPTTFDDFSEKASSTYSRLPREAIKNRKILIDVMSEYGFTVHPSEWWHFNYKDYTTFGLLDISFEELSGR